MLHSVRARLTFWYTAILAVVLVTFSGISYVLLARAIRASTDSSLAATARELTAAFTSDSVSFVPLDFRYSDRDITVFAPSGRIVAASRARMRQEELRRLATLARSGAAGFTTIAGGIEGDGIRVFAASVNVVGATYRVLVSCDLAEQDEKLERAARALLIGIPFALLVAAAGGYVMARKSLAPVTIMSAKARQIGAETLGERIEVGDGRDELAFLATTLNDLLERLQRAFESQRRFMADASHELRTPLSIIQGEADVALSRSDRSAAEYQESIAVMQSASRKLTRIVQDLFLLARSDAGTYPMTRSRFYLDELIADCMRGMRSVADAKQIELRCDVPPDSLFFGDEELIHRMLTNLVDNAVKFTSAGGRVSVNASASDAAYTITISDTGPGIDAADQPHVFERFFRGSRLRRRNAPGGAGLGLPIARWIAEIHGGKLWLEQSDSTGTTIIVSLPCEPKINGS